MRHPYRSTTCREERAVRAQHLRRHQAAESEVLELVHLARTSSAELLERAKAGELRQLLWSGRGGRRGRRRVDLPEHLLQALVALDERTHGRQQRLVPAAQLRQIHPLAPVHVALDVALE